MGRMVAVALADDSFGNVGYLVANSSKEALDQLVVDALSSEESRVAGFYAAHAEEKYCNSPRPTIFASSDWVAAPRSAVTARFLSWRVACSPAGLRADSPSTRLLEPKHMRCAISPNLSEEDVAMAARLRALTAERALAFTCSCAERLIPVWLLYRRVERLEIAANLFAAMLERLWASLSDQAVGSDILGDWERRLAGIPLDDSRCSTLTGFVEDAYASVWAAIQICRTGDSGYAWHASSAATGHADNWGVLTCQYEFGTNLGGRLAAAAALPIGSRSAAPAPSDVGDSPHLHAISCGERAKQLLDLDLLEAAPVLSAEMTSALRESSRRCGVQWLLRFPFLNALIRDA